jgi:hypothetical protein
MIVYFSGGCKLIYVAAVSIVRQDKAAAKRSAVAELTLESPT